MGCEELSPISPELASLRCSLGCLGLSLSISSQHQLLGPALAGRTALSSIQGTELRPQHNNYSQCDKCEQGEFLCDLTISAECHAVMMWSESYEL